ncbi:MAG: ribbon-helix-helix protein, CopG family [Polyangiaceae bacterium]|nr:ribbon-helix-helix protein, CopG family [Polyangiaceae bacterium]
MRTTLTLDDDLGARLEQLARQGHRSFKDVVNEVLRRGLDAKPPPARPFKVDARDMGLRPGRSLDDIGDLLEQLDGPGHK